MPLNNNKSEEAVLTDEFFKYTTVRRSIFSSG